MAENSSVYHLNVVNLCFLVTLLASCAIGEDVLSSFSRNLDSNRHLDSRRAASQNDLGDLYSKHAFSLNELIPSQYKIELIINNTKLDQLTVGKLVQSFAAQLEIPFENIGISLLEPKFGLIEIYVVYTMARNFPREAVSKDDIAVLLPASTVLKALSRRQLENDVGNIKVLSLQARSDDEQETVVDSRHKSIEVWTIFQKQLWAAWQLPLIITLALCAALAIILFMFFMCYRKEVRWKKKAPADDLRQIVCQPVFKPPLSDADTVQPESSYVTETESEHTPSPVRSPLRFKAKGLLERRGSNASLTLDLNRSLEDVHSGSPQKQRSNSGTEILLSAGNRMPRKQLRNCLKDVKTLHTEFWEIPMNHPEKVEIPGYGTKNRYKTILPNEHTRVKLSGCQGDPLSSYINANYVRGYDGEPKAYIATQGPMAHTLDDFWRMIWKEKAPVIVMITKLKEKNKVKCEPYVPVFKGSYGNIDITVQKVVPRDGYTIRELYLRNGAEAHQVVHFWYTTWPDHKTPITGKQILAMSVEVEALRHDNSGSTKGPTIVHCSAGIGRTGCFIATSIGIQQLLEEGMVDVLGIVCSLRLDRGGMVQTAEQYEFVHQALCLFERSLPDLGGE